MDTIKINANMGGGMGRGCEPGGFGFWFLLATSLAPAALLILDAAGAI